jgi:hypothetical protein
VALVKAAYEIRVAGEVLPGLLEDFADVTVKSDPASTTMHAVLADEAELHGLLEALRREGLVLLDVRKEQD